MVSRFRQEFPRSRPSIHCPRIVPSIFSQFCTGARVKLQYFCTLRFFPKGDCYYTTIIALPFRNFRYSTMFHYFSPNSACTMGSSRILKRACGGAPPISGAPPSIVRALSEHCPSIFSQFCTGARVKLQYFCTLRFCPKGDCYYTTIIFYFIPQTVLALWGPRGF